MSLQWQNHNLAKKSLTYARCWECIRPLLVVPQDQNPSKLSFASASPSDFPLLSMFRDFCDQLTMWRIERDERISFEFWTNCP